MKENESKEENEHAVKSYIKNSLNVDTVKSEYNRSNRVGPKIKRSGKTFQHTIVNCKGSVPRIKVSRARKHKADIAIHMDLTKCCYLLLKDAYDKAKESASVDFACGDINCSVCLRLKNGDWKFLSSLEEFERLLLEI